MTNHQIAKMAADLAKLNDGHISLLVSVLPPETRSKLYAHLLAKLRAEK